MNDVVKNTMNFLAQCENCGERFKHDNEGTNFTHAKEYKDKGGRSIWITYFDCPKCGRRHYVQIDDTRSNQLKNETFNLFKKLSKKRINGKDIPKKQNEKFKKFNNNLIEARMELMKRYQNQKVTCIETGEEVELHFSV